jgi:hypothetical protein
MPRYSERTKCPFCGATLDSSEERCGCAESEAADKNTDAAALNKHRILPLPDGIKHIRQSAEAYEGYRK